VEYGTTLTVVTTPDEAHGYKLKAIRVNAQPLADGVTTFKVKDDATTVEVEFELKTFTVTKELKGVTKGAITITGATNLDAVEYGTELTVKATTTEEGYKLKELKANGVDIKSTMKFAVKADTKVTAVFEKETSVEDTLFANVNVAPNPFTTQILVRSNGMTGTYTLLNAHGMVLRSGTLVGGEVSIETSDLSAGLYLLRLTTTEGATKVFRVVKH
jgi:internalin-related protein